MSKPLTPHPTNESSAILRGITDKHGQVPAWKRLLDLVLIALTSIVWVPLSLLIALYVKIVSPGPVLFKQERIGHLGRTFYCLKFRTMKVNADTVVHQKHMQELIEAKKPLLKLGNDQRLIRGGRILRSLGLDELPQLINILCGEMSLVGPRPCIAYEYALFTAHHRGRCETLPGLTGLWQVNGKNKTTFDRMMELDLTYVEKKSLGLDLKIIAATIPAIAVQVWDAKVQGRNGRTAPPSGNGTANSSLVSIVGK